jgi:beta-1,4-mannosyltransferase
MTVDQESLSRRSSPDARNLAVRRRVVHLPVYTENAYQPMLMEAQRKLGWDVIDGGGGGNFLRTALREWKADILHLHWLPPYMLRDGVMASWVRGMRFLAEIALVRRAGAKVVWTVHNLGNHEQRHHEVELALTRWFVRQCDLIFTHGQFAMNAARNRFRIPGKVPIFSLRFPNYCEQYAHSRSGYEGHSTPLPAEKLVVGFLGRVEPYKQVKELVLAFRATAQWNGRLIIGGRAASDEYAQSVADAIADDSRIEFLNRYIPNEKVADFLYRCDLVVCPSQGILTSSSVPLAMSFGRPVLAPSDGCIPEEVGDTGFLYDSGDPQGLRNGLLQVFAERDRLAELGQRALLRAMEATPERIAELIVAAYDSVLTAPTLA